MSSRILSGGAVAPITWRKIDPRERTRPQQADEPSDEASKQEIEQAMQDAYSKGYAAGVESCKSDAQAQVRQLVEKLSHSIQALADLRPRLRRNAEEDLVKLSIAVAQRILNRELSVDANSIQGIVRVALEKLQAKEINRVRIHPSHETAVRNCLANVAQSSQIQIVADGSLQPGDLIFETTQGSFDASLDFQLREIERGFADRLGA